MTRSSIYSIFVAALVFGLTACEPDAQERRPGPQNDDNNVIDDGKHDHPNEDDTHGEDDDQELIEVGFLNGTWRVATADADDTPLVYLDFVHDDGATDATGKFRMGIAMGLILDGEVGDLASASWSGETLKVTWNPTNDAEQVYTVTSTTRVDDDTLDATFTTVDGEQTFPVKITRQLPPEEPVRDDDPNAPIFPDE